MTVGQLVIQYVNEEIRIGEYVTRQGLIQYVSNKLAEEAGLDPNKYYRFKNNYTTVDNYRRTLQLNHILSESDGSGSYIKYHNIPEGITIHSLQNRIGNGNPLFRKGESSIMETWMEIENF